MRKHGGILGFIFICKDRFENFHLHWQCSVMMGTISYPRCTRVIYLCTKEQSTSVMCVIVRDRYLQLWTDCVCRFRLCRSYLILSSFLFFFSRLCWKACFFLGGLCWQAFLVDLLKIQTLYFSVSFKLCFCSICSADVNYGFSTL